MNFRSRPVGWRGDSYRHYLASKGVRSGHFVFKTKVPVKDEMRGLTEYSQFNDVSPRHKYRLFVREMSPDEYLRLSKSTDPDAWKFSQGEWEASGRTKEGRLIRDEERIARIKQGILSKRQVVPLPQVVYDSEGNLEEHQEGRHRALAARDLGMEKIPVVVAVRRTAGDRALDDEDVVLPLNELQSGSAFYPGQKFGGWESAKEEEQYMARKMLWLEGSSPSESPQEYVLENVKSRPGGMKKFTKEVKFGAVHPMKDLDDDWERYTALADNDVYGPRGKPEPLASDKIHRSVQRGAALMAKVLSQANVEPLLDHGENSNARDLMLDLQFGRLDHEVKRK